MSDRYGGEMAGQSSDFDEFVRTRSTALLRTAYLLTGDKGHAEDLLQDVFAAMYARWRSIRTSPEAYARRALVHRSINRWRRLGAIRFTAMPQDLAAPEDPISRLTARDAIVRALMQLSPRQRVALVLRYFDDLSEAEAAAVMGCSGATVRSHVATGLARLRAMPDFNAAPTTAGDNR